MEDDFLPTGGQFLRTARLELRPVGGGDIADLIRLKADPLAYGMMLGGVCMPAQTMIELQSDCALWGRLGIGIWAVREGGVFLGITGLHERADGRGFGLRFAFLPNSRGRGLAREAAGAALRHAHERGVGRVVAVARSTNFASLTVLGAIGMRRESEFVRGGFRMIVFASERSDPSFNVP